MIISNVEIRKNGFVIFLKIILKYKQYLKEFRINIRTIRFPITLVQ